MPPSGKERAHCAGGAESARGRRSASADAVHRAHGLERSYPETHDRPCSSSRASTAPASDSFLGSQRVDLHDCRLDLRPISVRIVQKVADELVHAGSSDEAKRRTDAIFDEQLHVHGSQSMWTRNTCQRRRLPPGASSDVMVARTGRTLDVGGRRWHWRDGGREPLSVPVQVTQRYADGGRRLIGDRFLDVHRQIALAFSATR